MPNILFELIADSFLTLLLLTGLVIIVLSSKKVRIEGIQYVWAFIGIVLAITFLESLEDIIIERNYSIVFRYIKTSLVYFLYPALPLMEVLIIKKRAIKKYLLLLLPLAIDLILVIADLFGTGIIYSFKGGYFSAGPLRFYPLMLICLYLIVLTQTSFGMIKNGDKKRFAIVVFIVCSTVLDMILEYTNIISGLTDETAAVDMILYCYYISSIYYAEVQEKLYESELELSKNTVKLLIAQIQPHFIYNSLYSIKALCRQDPDKAALVVQDFSEYLRANFDSLGSEKKIPFNQELSHIRKYISLEKVNPKLDLTVEYQLEIKDFSLPALTIEPLVENAIRHGIASRQGGGVVTIHTCEDEKNIYVTVEDNGRGMDSSLPEQRERKGIGLENVKKRLQVECGGTIGIESSINGTKVTVTMPKGEPEEARNSEI